MERMLYISTDFCAVVEDGRLAEYIPGGGDAAAGTILWGRVERLMPSLGCAFVDIGRKRAGFLPLKENSATFTGGPLVSGDRLPVQIRKEEVGGKGAFLSRDLSLAGSYLILMPMNRFVGVSARVKDEAIRGRLMKLGQELTGGMDGLVLRSSALDAEPAELAREFAELKQQWEKVREKIGRATDPGTVLLGSSAEEELKNHYAPRGIDRILRNEALSPDLLRQLREASNRRIRLPHGGNIVIDRCEAMTVVDVNTGEDIGMGNRRSALLRTNLEACQEIALQVRLRNLSGILILDMIDMDEASDREQVLAALEEAFSRDRIKTVIHGWTHLGLVEMTRKRTRPPLAESWNSRAGKEPE